MENAKGELVPGGLAMVYGVTPIEFNGFIVVLKSIISDGDLVIDGHRYSGEPSWWCESERLVARTACGRIDKGFGFVDPRNLMPINPQADPLHTEQDQCMTA